MSPCPTWLENLLINIMIDIVNDIVVVSYCQRTEHYKATLRNEYYFLVAFVYKGKD